MFVEETDGKGWLGDANCVKPESRNKKSVTGGQFIVQAMNQVRRQGRLLIRLEWIEFRGTHVVISRNTTHQRCLMGRHEHDLAVTDKLDQQNVAVLMAVKRGARARSQPKKFARVRVGKNRLNR